MRKKFLSLPLSILGASLFILPIAGCSSSSNGDKIVIKVLNSEDYIYLNDPDNGYNDPDLVDQFVEYMKEEKGLDVSVVYDTSDTNESIYNDLLSGRATYDLVNASDYMVQKFVREGLVVPIDRNLIPNYVDYVSTEIGERLDRIEVNMDDGTKASLADYAIGYMWGTLGLLFNPTYDSFPSEADPLNDLSTFEGLWDTRYKGTMTIKDSMRDTVAVAVMHMYKDTLDELAELYNSGEIDSNTYNSELSYLFNIISNAEDKDVDETLSIIKNSLNSLKGNIFGMEVDSGKQDMVTGKIGINLAWSGDAVYSMDQAEEEREIELYYSLPITGSNIWFDAWSMPKNDKRTDAQYEVACEFLNFISDPYIASQNMDYTGYTPFIGGDSILDMARDWYDARTDLIYYYDEENDYYYDLYYIDPLTEEELTVWYDDCHFDYESDELYDEVELYYYDSNEEVVPYGLYNEDLLIDEEWSIVDLSYFFNGTLDEYEDDVDTIFYAEYYKEDNGAVGRQFYCQYPDEESVIRCCVMDDYGSRNTKVLRIWESFKSNPLPTWAVVLIIVEVVLIGGLIIFFVQRNYIKKRIRLKRLANKEK